MIMTFCLDIVYSYESNEHYVILFDNERPDVAFCKMLLEEWETLQNDYTKIKKEIKQ